MCGVQHFDGINPSLLQASQGLARTPTLEMCRRGYAPQPAYDGDDRLHARKGPRYVRRSAICKIAVKRFAHGAHLSRLHHGPRDMGTPNWCISRLLSHFLRRHRHTQMLQSVENFMGALRAVRPLRGKQIIQLGVVGWKKVPEQVQLPPPHLDTEFASRDDADTRRGYGLGNPFSRIVIGQRDRGEAGTRGRARDVARSDLTVRRGRMEVEIHHPHDSNRLPGVVCFRTGPGRLRLLKQANQLPVGKLC